MTERTKTTDCMSIDPTKVWLHVNELRGGLSLPDGVHYAVKGSLTAQQIIALHVAIVHRINVALVDQLVPAGLIRGVLLPTLPIQNMPLDERDVMYDCGVNPIVLRGGKPILWGNHFVFRGVIYEMFGMFRPVHPYLAAFLLTAQIRFDYLSITREIVESQQ